MTPLDALFFFGFLICLAADILWLVSPPENPAPPVADDRRPKADDY